MIANHDEEMFVNTECMTRQYSYLSTTIRYSLLEHVQLRSQEIHTMHGGFSIYLT